MEIAVQTIFILFFVALPGVIFRRFYFQGEFTKQFDSKGWSHSIFLSLIYGLGIHLMLFLVFYYYGYIVSIEHFNELTTALKDWAVPNFSNPLDLGLMFWYLGLLFLIPVFSGFGLYYAIRLSNLDLNYAIFRFSNHWHYYFKGEIRKHRDFPSLSKDKKKKVLLTTADVLCKETENSNILYSGMLSQYTVCKSSGKLDYIYLTKSNKYEEFNTDTEGPATINSLSGDCLIIASPTIININLRYVYAEVKSLDLSKLFTTILFVFYLFNWIEPMTITKFGLISGIAIKLIRHVLIFSLINLIHSALSKEQRGDTRVGFWFLTIIFVTVYVLTRYLFLSSV